MKALLRDKERGFCKPALLTETEIREWAVFAVDQMNDEDKADFLADPDQWRNGIESNHVIAHRDGVEIYCDDWSLLREALIEAINDES